MQDEVEENLDVGAAPELRVTTLARDELAERIHKSLSELLRQWDGGPDAVGRFCGGHPLDLRRIFDAIVRELPAPTLTYYYGPSDDDTKH